MSSVFYLANKARDTDIIADSLQRKGLPYIRTVPSQFHLVCTSPKDALYQVYKTHLPEYVRATLTRDICPLQTFSVPVYDYNLDFPAAYPPLAIEYKSVSRELSETLIDHRQASMTKVERRTVFVIDDPTGGKYSQLPEKSAILAVCRVPRNTVNLHALNVFAKVRAILRSIYVTHSYPSTYDDDTEEKREDVTMSSQEEQQPNLHSDSEEESDESRKRSRSKAGLDADAGHRAKKLAVSRKYAKPQKTDHSFYGQPHNIPTDLPGLFIAYEPEMAEDDPAGVPDFLQTYMLRNLGNSIESAMIAISDIRSAWGVVTTTMAGRQVDHMVKSLEVSLETGTRPFLVYREGSYLGTVLLGDAFTVVSRNTVYRPVSSAEMLKTVHSSDIHRKTLESLREICALDLTEVKTMRELSKMLQSVESLKSRSHEVQGLCAKLKFLGDDLWAPNETNVLKALSLLNSGADIPNDVPLHGDSILETDRVKSVLAAFGNSVPSFCLPVGVNESVLAKSQPGNLFYTTKPLANAYTDMIRLIETSTITNWPGPTIKVKGNFRSLKALKGDVWAQIKGLPKAQHSVSSSSHTTGGSSSLSSKQSSSLDDDPF